MSCTRLSLLSLSALLAACSPSPIPTVCRTGETLACTCEDGRSGAQSCVDDGSRFDACVCAGEGEGEGEPDAGRPDAGAVDAGPAEADAGAGDAGPGLEDGGLADDAGLGDGGPDDAGISYVLPAACNGSVVTLEAAVPAEGSIGAVNDIDCFLIAAPARSLVVVTLTTDENLDLELYDATGQRIAVSEGQAAVEELAVTTGGAEVFIAVVDPYSDAIGAYDLLFSTSLDEGKDFSSAVEMDINTTVDGSIQLSDDADFFRIEVGTGILRLSFAPTTDGAFSLALYSPEEELLMQEEGSGPLQITSAVATPGPHYAVVGATEGDLGAYTLQAELLDD